MASQTTISTTSTTSPAPQPTDPHPSIGIRKNGKQWHAPKPAFRPTAGLTSYTKRLAQRHAHTVLKAREREAKAEAEEERQRRVTAIKERRAAKEEKERFALLAEKMHRKRVERVRKREKRNKILRA